MCAILSKIYLKDTPQFGSGEYSGSWSASISSIDIDLAKNVREMVVDNDVFDDLPPQQSCDDLKSLLATKIIVA